MIQTLKEDVTQRDLLSSIDNWNFKLKFQMTDNVNKKDNWGNCQKDALCILDWLMGSAFYPKLEHVCFLKFSRIQILYLKSNKFSWVQILLSVKHNTCIRQNVCAEFIRLTDGCKLRQILNHRLLNVLSIFWGHMHVSKCSTYLTFNFNINFKWTICTCYYKLWSFSSEKYPFLMGIMSLENVQKEL